MLEKLDGETRLYPIIGDPIKFAKSPQRLTRGFESRGLNAICVPMQVPKGDLDGVLRGLTQTANVDGLLVTMPHKSAAFAYCSTYSETAKLFGSVSVMRRNRDGTWHGEMLDGLAFVKAQIDGGARVKEARVLLLGAGAAGSAIAMALLDAGARELLIYDSDEARAAQLVKILTGAKRGKIHIGPADPTDCDLVCNATPSGMDTDDPIPVSPALLTASMFVGDVVAGHGVTPLLRAAQSAGCKTANGVDMVEAVQEMMLHFMMG